MSSENRCVILRFGVGTRLVAETQRPRDVPDIGL